MYQYNNTYINLHKYLKGKKIQKKLLKKKNLGTIATVPLGTVATAQKYYTNKCHNIFTKHLFSVVVGHSFIFYYFILTYKKLTPQ